MSFRVRVLALVALVAVAATTLTAWLTLQQASRQVTESEEAQRRDIELVTGELATYGQTHGTWVGVPPLVQDLQARTGERIRLETEFGEVVADTDHLADRAAREVETPPISTNPYPTLDLSGLVFEEGPAAGARVALQEIDEYRSSLLLAACLTRAGLGVRLIEGEYGVPRHRADPAAAVGSPDQVEECDESTVAGEAARREDAAQVEQCTGPPLLAEPDPRGDGVPPESGRTTEQDAVAECLAGVFAGRIAEVAPVPLLVYLGAAGEESGSPLSAGPVLAAAGLVTALAVAGSLLISRRVLRPIGALTAASRRLGQGDLSERVPVAGRDELAGLARSFNRMADSLQRGEERQRRLVADVAHELRTPLANLRGYLEALKDGVVSPDPELFSSLYEEAVLQQRIVDDLQDLALAEAGTLIYHRSRVDLGELLETCRTAHQAVAEAAGVRLAAATTGAVEVHADADRLRQVLGNLVGNALRATGAGGSVTLAGGRAGAWAVVTVTDTGTGIAPEYLPYLFDRFWRADPARGRTTGGVGLGLAIARQIVTDHGGTIEVASTQGAGTTFTVRLPVLDAGPATPVAVLQ